MHEKTITIISWTMAIAIAGMIAFMEYPSCESYRKKRASETIYTEQVDGLSSVEQAAQVNETAD